MLIKLFHFKGITLFAIRGYIHSYRTKRGREITTEQDTALIDSGLFGRSESITQVHIQEPDNKQYEGTTLEALWQTSKTFDGLIWYIHSKGATQPESKKASYNHWRYTMERTIIWNWEKCVAEFATDPSLDCYGAELPDDDRYFFPGNFWWARSSHITRLPSPIEWAEKLCGRSGTDIRYGYEDWITLSVPNIKARAAGVWKE